MTKWEYKHVNEKLEERALNRLGEEGWELVTHTAAVAHGSFGQYYVFKREKEPAVSFHIPH